VKTYLGNLSWKELQDVILDVEVTLNNRPLDYVEDNVQQPTLTLNSMLFGQSNTILQLEPHNIEDTDLRKRAKYLRRCKDAVWHRWTKEYLRALRQRHNLKHTQPKRLNK
jgi:nicotinic acid mononucleotide adenylyltransferase